MNARWSWLVGALLVAVACSSSKSSDDGPAVLPPEEAGAPDAADRIAPPPPPDDGASNALSYPPLLSQTGLYSDFGARKFADGLIAFAPRWSFWVDGAEKDRHLYLPPGTKIDTTDMDFWKFPVGTKVWKEFKADGK